MAAAVKIQDADGAKFWADQFKDQDKVPNKDFAAKLHGSIPNAPSLSSVENVVNFIVDSADQDGHVSKKEFDFFLSRFGPFATAVQKTQKNLFMPNGSLVPWFFGCAPREKADAAFSKDGQFLLRFSERFPTKLTISFAKFDPNTKKGNHRHILVENCAEGYKLEGTPANPNGQVFPSIPELLRLQGSYEGAESDIYRRFVSTVKLEAPAAHNAYQSIDALAADHKASGGGGGHYSDFETVSGGVHKSASSSSGHYSDFETTVGGGGHHGGGGAYAPIDELAGKGHFGKGKAQPSGGSHYEAFDDQGADFVKPKAAAKPAGNHYEAFDEDEDLAAKK